jgi:hypothetical protein
MTTDVENELQARDEKSDEKKLCLGQASNQTEHEMVQSGQVQLNGLRKSLQ